MIHVIGYWALELAYLNFWVVLNDVWQELSFLALDLTNNSGHFLSNFRARSTIWCCDPSDFSFTGSFGTFLRVLGFTGDLIPVPAAALSFRRASMSRANKPERGFTGRRSGLSKGFVFIGGVG